MCEKCKECSHGENLINGRWCWKLMFYVEYCETAPCVRNISKTEKPLYI